MTITPEMSVEQVAEQAVTLDYGTVFYCIRVGGKIAREGPSACRHVADETLRQVREGFADILRADRAAREQKLRGMLEEARDDCHVVLNVMIHDGWKKSKPAAVQNQLNLIARIDAVLNEVTP